MNDCTFRTGTKLVKGESKGPQVPGEVRKLLGQQLRGMYNEIVAQRIPERFKEVLRQLGKPDHERRDSSRKVQ